MKDKEDAFSSHYRISYHSDTFYPKDSGWVESYWLEELHNSII
jgi:hypothetical protein